MHTEVERTQKDLTHLAAQIRTAVAADPAPTMTTLATLAIGVAREIRLAWVSPPQAESYLAITETGAVSGGPVRVKETRIYPRHLGDFGGGVAEALALAVGERS